MSRGGSTRLYIGNLSSRTRERDLEDYFSKYGRIASLDLKGGFAFLEYSDPRDAEDAVRALDGYDIDGSRIRVEYSHGARGGVRARDKAPFRGDFRILVEGLSRDTSWQDLKDLARKSGDVVFADVFMDRNGEKRGAVEYRRKEDAKSALRDIDGIEYRGHRLRATEDRGRSRSRSRSRSPRDRRHSRSRSPPRKSDTGSGSNNNAANTTTSAPANAGGSSNSTADNKPADSSNPPAAAPAGGAPATPEHKSSP